MTLGIPETNSETYGIRYINKKNHPDYTGDKMEKLPTPIHPKPVEEKSDEKKPDKFDITHNKYSDEDKKRELDREATHNAKPHEQGVNYYSSGMGDKSKLVPEAHKKYEGETSNMQNIHSVPHARDPKTNISSQVLTYQGDKPKTTQRQPEGEHKPKDGKPYTISPTPVKHHTGEGEIHDPTRKVEKIQYNNYIISGMSPMIAKLTMINRSLDELLKRQKGQPRVDGKLIDQTTGLPMNTFDEQADKNKPSPENIKGQNRGRDETKHPDVPNVTDALAYIKDTKEKEPIQSFNEPATNLPKTDKQKEVIAAAKERDRNAENKPEKSKFDMNNANNPNDKRFFASGKKARGTNRGGSYR